MSRRRVLIAAIAGICLIGLVYHWNEYRSVALHEALNPMYWLRRLRGEDLYDPERRVLYHGNRQYPEVALTIDDGPHEPTGSELLDVLRDHGVKATFFVVGEQIKKHPDLIRRMLAEGHEVGNHTQTHLRLDTLPERNVHNEINNCDINFHRVTGRHFRLLRPPGVRYNDEVLEMADRMGYVIVSWNCAARDFEQVTSDFIVRRITRRIENGSIILLHDDWPSLVEALPRVINSLRESGYRFVTISEMLARLPKPVLIKDSGQRRQKTKDLHSTIGYVRCSPGLLAVPSVSIPLDLTSDKHM